MIDSYTKHCMRADNVRCRRLWVRITNSWLWNETVRRHGAWAFIRRLGIQLAGLCVLTKSDQCKVFVKYSARKAEGLCPSFCQAVIRSPADKDVDNVGRNQQSQQDLELEFVPC